MPHRAYGDYSTTSTASGTTSSESDSKEAGKTMESCANSSSVSKSSAAGVVESGGTISLQADGAILSSANGVVEFGGAISSSAAGGVVDSVNKNCDDGGKRQEPADQRARAALGSKNCDDGGKRQGGSRSASVSSQRAVSVVDPELFA